MKRAGSSSPARVFVAGASKNWRALHHDGVKGAISLPSRREAAAAPRMILPFTH
jgi:hypothetical protein